MTQNREVNLWDFGSLAGFKEFPRGLTNKQIG